MLDHIKNHRPNASNFIITGKRGMVLMVKHKHFNGKWGLPGGAIEYRETGVRAGEREVFEELNLTIDSPKRLVAVLIQRTPKRVLDELQDFPREGILLLYEVNTSIDEDVTTFEPTDEVLESRFFDFEELLGMREEVSLAYTRMLIIHHRISKGGDTRVYEDLLSNQQEIRLPNGDVLCF